jgi:hypothetical protein
MSSHRYHAIEPFIVNAKVLRPGMSLSAKSQPSPKNANRKSQTIDWVVTVVEFLVVAPFTACSALLLLWGLAFAFSGFSGPAGFSIASLTGMCIVLGIVTAGAYGLTALWMLLLLSREYLAQHMKERRFAVVGVCIGIALTIFYLCLLWRDVQMRLLGIALIGIALHRLWRVNEVMRWFTRNVDEGCGSPEQRVMGGQSWCH